MPIWEHIGCSMLNVGCRMFFIGSRVQSADLLFREFSPWLPLAMLKKLFTIFGGVLLLVGLGLLIGGAVEVFGSAEQFKATARVKVVALTQSEMGRPMFGRQPYQ